MTNKEVKNRLKKLRIENELTQKKLHEETGFPIRSLQNWENGDRKINEENAQKLADHFGVSVGYLLGYSDTKLDIEQVKKEIQNYTSRNNEPIDEVSLNTTIELLKQVNFLNLDLETVVNLYFYNLSDVHKVDTLSDLLYFFDSEAKAWISALEVAEGYESDGIISRINKLGEYREELNQYLEILKSDEEFFQDTGYKINSIKAQEEIKQMIEDYDTDFLDFLKYHDLYLADNEIDLITNLMYSMSNKNNLFLSNLGENNYEQFELQKKSNYSQLFDYSSQWQMQAEGYKYINQEEKNNNE